MALNDKHIGEKISMKKKGNNKKNRNEPSKKSHQRP